LTLFASNNSLTDDGLPIAKKQKPPEPWELVIEKGRVEQAYKTQYSNKSTEGQQSLARTFLKEGKSASSKQHCFLLTEAERLARSVGHIETALTANRLL
jgi:hypothetical protein